MKNKVRGNEKERDLRIEEREEVRNGMGEQTWVNLASGGHTLPEETGASRLASTLMAFTYTLTHSHTHTHTWSGPVLENSYTTGTWD